MPDEGVPLWIERLLSRTPYRSAESQHVLLRQAALHRYVTELVAGHEEDLDELRFVCVERLRDKDDEVVQNALAILFVVGNGQAVPAVEDLARHPTKAVRKSAGACLHEIRQRERAR